MRLFVLIVFYSLSISVKAQRDNRPVQIAHYVLDSFTMGKVKMRSGVLYDQKLNYNVLTNEMIFWDGKRYMAIAEPRDVDTVYIDTRKFIPVDAKFYELLLAGPDPLFMEYVYKIDEPPVSVGYGNASPTTNSTSLTSLVTTGGVYDLKLPDDFKVIPIYNYLVRKDGRYEKVNSTQQFIKLFPGKKKLIKEFTKTNNTNFSNKADVIRLMHHVQLEGL